MSLSISGTHDIRPFQKIVSHSLFTYFPNSFDPELTFEELSAISCDPRGMAWGIDNQTLYYSDAHTKVISKCDYNLREVDVTNCETLFDVTER